MTQRIALKTTLFALVMLVGHGCMLPERTCDEVQVQPSGASALASNMDRLFILDNETMAFSESSYDRRGLNVDLPCHSLGNPYPTYLGVDKHGDRILLDVKGVGCVYRLFMSEFDHRTTARLKIYFDGSDTPAVNEKVVDLCQGKTVGFPAPLVHIRNQAGSGIWPTCQHNDVPLPFARGIRITCDETGENFYPNIQYHLFAPGTPVKTWSPDQDLSAAMAVMNRCGHDPKSQVGNTAVSGRSELRSGKMMTLFKARGAKQIQSIKIRIAGLSQWNGDALSHGGKSFTGASAFNAALFPRNDGVKLKRLHLVKPGAGCAARVLVDGAEVGLWRDRAEKNLKPDESFWRESEFFIPAKFTRGKSSIAVRIESADGSAPWNECRYRVYSMHVDCTMFNPKWDAIDKLTKGTGLRLSDILEIGDKKSEGDHHYTCTGESWSGVADSHFPVRDTKAYLGWLNNIRVKAYWDGDMTPAVDAPLSGFFGQSRFGMDWPDHSVAARTLPVGLDEDDFLYCYFPMPFQKSAMLELVAGDLPANAAVEYEIQSKAFTGYFQNVGYFKAHEIYENKAEKDTTNFILLDVQGSGKIVGVTSNMEQSKPTVKGAVAFLEGDERIYVDGSKTSAICGSGKEDFHGGSYYFYGGPYTLPLSGCSYNTKWGFNSHPGGSNPFRCSAYRFMVSDSVPFRNGVRFDIEHGSHMNYPGWPGEEKDAPNHDQEESHYLTFYYHKPEPAMALSDTLDVADAASQAAHHYDATGKTLVTKTGNWDRNGYYDQTNHTASGFVLSKGTDTVFTLSLDRRNNGVMLRRLMWYAEANQEAEVFVDGQKVGTWYDAGKNWQKETDQKPMLWRETQFLIPASFTKGKRTIQVKLNVLSPNWNEYKYEVFSCK